MNFLTDPLNFIIGYIRGWLLGLGVPSSWAQFILFVIGAGILATVPMLITLGLIWAERKILGRIQDRLGPNRVGPWGMFQTMADMIKIFTKELITPENADRIPYNLAPILSVAGVLALWAVIPFGISILGVNLNVGILYLIAVGGFGTLGFMLAGWGSNNKYALLGAFRAIAQLISYEVPMALSLLIPVMFTGSLGMADIVAAQDVWFIVLSPVAALIFFIATIAEVGRSPFDLLEADSELVSGFNIEYSGLKFGMFYVADFLHAFTVALLFSTIFLGGWRGPLAAQYPWLGFVYLLIKTVIVWFLSILIRGSMPRIRIDQMMFFNWKILTPLSLGLLVTTALVDKAIPAPQTALRAISMLILNGLLLLITNFIWRAVSAQKERPVVAAQPYGGQKTGIKKVSS